jgi:uncharacterized cofD-like protein
MPLSRPGAISAAQFGPFGHGPKVVAVGGGHGLSATLSALRRLTDNVTAIVGVADDGGSSGRLRAEFAIPPPGDLRMALAALCGDDPVGRSWRNVLQHRFTGAGPLGGHAVGNLLISALWEQTGDVVAGLDFLSALVETHGRVLPSTTVPMELVAMVRDLPGEPAGAVVEICGQANVARSGGMVVDIRLSPPDAPVCEEAAAAVADADYVVLGPGSWFTSVLPHFELTELRAAIVGSPAMRILVLNLQSHTAETVGFEPHTHLEVLGARYPDVALDLVIADPRSVGDVAALDAAARAVGAKVRFERLAAPAPAEELPTVAHSPDLLAAAFAAVMERGRITPWR